jgi:hypothetical protein
MLNKEMQVKRFIFLSGTMVELSVPIERKTKSGYFLFIHLFYFDRHYSLEQFYVYRKIEQEVQSTYILPLATL